MSCRYSMLAIASLVLCSLATAAEQVKDVSYYPADFAGSGDLKYRSERCKLDICIPEHDLDKKLPTIVWFHGGGLSSGEKSIIKEFAAQKIILVAANYRLIPKAKEPDFIEDAAAAVAWTCRNIEKHGGDVRKIFVGGHSAGGYLTMMVGMNSKYLAAHDLKNTDLAGLFPVSGQATTHFAIVAAAQKGRPRAANLTRDNPITINEYAPLAFTDQKLPPMYLLCGDATIEWPARVEENALLAAMIRTVTDHNVIEYRSFPGTNHGTCLKPSLEYICKTIADNE